MANPDFIYSNFRRLLGKIQKSGFYLLKLSLFAGIIFKNQDFISTIFFSQEEGTVDDRVEPTTRLPAGLATTRQTMQHGGHLADTREELFSRLQR